MIQLMVIYPYLVDLTGLFILLIFSLFCFVVFKTFFFKFYVYRCGPDVCAHMHSCAHIGLSISVCTSYMHAPMEGRWLQGTQYMKEIKPRSPTCDFKAQPISKPKVLLFLMLELFILGKVKCLSMMVRLLGIIT